MLKLLKQLQINDDCIEVRIGSLWYSGIISQVVDDLIILRSEEGNGGAYFSTVIRIDRIDILQFTSDFRPNQNGCLISPIEVEDIQ